MLKNTTIISFALVLLIFCIGCSNNAQKIILDIADDKGNYKERIEILDKDQVSIVHKILNNAEWEEENEASFGLLKYKMSFAFIDSNKEVKTSYYLIYIYSNEQLILVENDAKFTKLSIEDSKKLFDILPSDTESLRTTVANFHTHIAVESYGAPKR
ncbi:hypothetical protein PVA17_15705 [Lysinibacillus sp. CNPSo 3705]|uniref:hypothetical protein n=1 Tax=Lysinibacillus sp. CNPSo 3705 TaxID=3028148 RepID=UPI0023645993|nr:hypothetical protein [Lysinibacillus sp. CNPSo 3705]MDD1504190.1 hypothetical protein [Lysinibacillus sp. CNPSo 3705]